MIKHIMNDNIEEEKVKMYENIEKIIELGYEIIIEKVRYGTGFYVAFDLYDLDYKPFAELLEGIGGFDDLAVEYMHTLETIELKYPDYPVACAKSLEEGFKKVNEKAERWVNNYKYRDQDTILKEIVTMVKELEKRWN